MKSSTSLLGAAYLSIPLPLIMDDMTLFIATAVFAVGANICSLLETTIYENKKPMGDGE